MKADEFISALNIPKRYVALSADDTKLLPKLKQFKDRESGQYYIVGGTGEPLLVTDPGSLDETLQNAKIELATKVCQQEVFLS